MSVTAISVRSPWWWYILHAGKDIENRSRPTSFRGTLYIHASSWWNDREVGLDWEVASRISGAMAQKSELRSLGGRLVGSVELVDCVRASKSPWFFGEYGYVLRNPVVLADPVPFKGMLGLFSVPDDVLTGTPRRAPQGALSLFGGDEG